LGGSKNNPGAQRKEDKLGKWPAPSLGGTGGKGGWGFCVGTKTMFCERIKKGKKKFGSGSVWNKKGNGVQQEKFGA